ncbi:NAD(P)-dependent oxidoreductase [Bacteroides salyersiae]|uniref:NAD(P)-dependent oxidoreductase n=1 Tax=Bacteroides salyersiae TaxID=291644 RepID=UPI002220908B|nr:NAD(P)H-binding protein [Bacteroides salyersiae]UYU41087.1 NAD(P)H-binding protein [Bacteroides salyersiae]
MKNVVLIGASGFVGNAILNELLNRGHHVTAIVREKAKVKVNSPKLEVKEIDVENVPVIVDTLKGADAVISAYNPGWSNPNIYEDTLRVYPKILDEVKAAGIKRLLIVGGAGTLFVKPGVRLVDTGLLPEAWLPGVKSLGKFFLETLVNEKDLDWVFFSPAANLGNLTTGIRTGKFRLGKDDLIVDKKGDSFISVEDYAMAMVDELEQENHHQERFTIGY